ncbi:hypothetical protein OUZ56_013270 [Daphnia magna]|uniref:Uncharacterized protein n=1 Tax=Daphnia magna TaxID=35525 RepID=A0ABQ9Z5G2_9CRUS|nr:hypothetical protein OUZ56_013270 [Daphnia magna]
MVPQGMSSKRTALCLSGVFKNPLEIPQILLNMGMESADTSPQFILSGPQLRTFNRSMYETVRI